MRKNNYVIPTPVKEFRSDNIFAIAELIYHGVSLEKIHELTMITPYFLEAFKNIIDTTSIPPSTPGIKNRA